MSSRLRNASGPRPLRGLLAAAAITLLACGGDTAPTATPGPPVILSVSPSELSLLVGVEGRLTAQASDTKGRATSAVVEWSSASPSVATVRKDGTVTAVAAGTTTVTASAETLRATPSVTVTATVEPDSLYEQWATAATASSEWSVDMWSAAQATGAPNVTGCADDPRAWASLSPDGVDWLELTYAQPVRPSEIRIHEIWRVGSIVKVEVKDLSGEYHTVYTAQRADPQPYCPRTVIITVNGVTAMVSTVRLSVDQRLSFDWNEIDAVRLAGYR